MLLHKRQHLRAPYNVPVLFEDGSFVHKCQALNISEGGMLLEHVPHLPDSDLVPILTCLPQFPRFKNYSLMKLKGYTPELFPGKIVRLKTNMVRRDGVTTSVDDVFKTRFGIQFVEIGPAVQRLISEYVEVFAGNIIYLQKLIEDSTSFAESLAMARELARILAYPENVKIAELRRIVGHDYKSLQWI